MSITISRQQAERLQRTLGVMTSLVALKYGNQDPRVTEEIALSDQLADEISDLLYGESQQNTTVGGLSQTDLVNIISGIGCPDEEFIPWLEEQQLGQYWGGAHHPWEWNRKNLQEKPAYTLQQIYNHLTKQNIKITC